MKRNTTNGSGVRANFIEKTLASLDDIARAKPLPFLYLRIQARLNSTPFSSKQYSILEKIGFFFSRPAIAFSILLLIVFFDGLAIQSTLTGIRTRSENTNEEFLRSDDNAEEMLFYDTPESEWAYIY